MSHSSRPRFCGGASSTSPHNTIDASQNTPKGRDRMFKASADGDRQPRYDSYRPNGSVQRRRPSIGKTQSSPPQQRPWRDIDDFQVGGRSDARRGPPLYTNLVWTKLRTAGNDLSENQRVSPGPLFRSDFEEARKSSDTVARSLESSASPNKRRCVTKGPQDRNHSDPAWTSLLPPCQTPTKGSTAQSSVGSFFPDRDKETRSQDHVNEVVPSPHSQPGMPNDVLKEQKDSNSELSVSNCLPDALLSSSHESTNTVTNANAVAPEVPVPTLPLCSEHERDNVSPATHPSLRLNSQLHLDLRKGQSPSSEGIESGLHTPSDTSSTPSGMRRIQCHICKDLASDFKPLARCCHCKRRYHLGCHNPRLTDVILLKAEWRCKVCVEKGQRSKLPKGCSDETVHGNPFPAETSLAKGHGNILASVEDGPAPKRRRLMSDEAPATPLVKASRPKHNEESIVSKDPRPRNLPATNSNVVRHHERPDDTDPDPMLSSPLNQMIRLYHDLEQETQRWNQQGTSAEAREAACALFHSRFAELDKELHSRETLDKHSVSEKQAQATNSSSVLVPATSPLDKMLSSKTESTGSTGDVSHKTTSTSSAADAVFPIRTNMPKMRQDASTVSSRGRSGLNATAPSQFLADTSHILTLTATAPYLFIASVHIPVTEELLHSLRCRFDSRDVRATRKGYYIIFEDSSAGADEAWTCFQAFHQKSLQAYVMIMSVHLGTHGNQGREMEGGTEHVVTETRPCHPGRSSFRKSTGCNGLSSPRAYEAATEKSTRLESPLAGSMSGTTTQESRNSSATTAQLAQGSSPFLPNTQQAEPTPALVDTGDLSEASMSIGTTPSRSTTDRDIETTELDMSDPAKQVQASGCHDAPDSESHRSGVQAVDTVETAGLISASDGLRAGIPCMDRGGGTQLHESRQDGRGEGDGEHVNSGDSHAVDATSAEEVKSSHQNTHHQAHSRLEQPNSKKPIPGSSVPGEAGMANPDSNVDRIEPQGVGRPPKALSQIRKCKSCGKYVVKADLCLACQKSDGGNVRQRCLTSASTAAVKSPTSLAGTSNDLFAFLAQNNRPRNDLQTMKSAQEDDASHAAKVEGQPRGAGHATSVQHRTAADENICTGKTITQDSASLVKTRKKLTQPPKKINQSPRRGADSDEGHGLTSVLMEQKQDNLTADTAQPPPSSSPPCDNSLIQIEATNKLLEDMAALRARREILEHESTEDKAAVAKLKKQTLNLQQALLNSQLRLQNAQREQGSAKQQSDKLIHHLLFKIEENKHFAGGRQLQMQGLHQENMKLQGDFLKINQELSRVSQEKSWMYDALRTMEQRSLPPGKDLAAYTNLEETLKKRDGQLDALWNENVRLQQMLKSKEEVLMTASRRTRGAQEALEAMKDRVRLDNDKAICRKGDPQAPVTQQESSSLSLGRSASEAHPQGQQKDYCRALHTQRGMVLGLEKASEGRPKRSPSDTDRPLNSLPGAVNQSERKAPRYDPTPLDRALAFQQPHSRRELQRTDHVFAPLRFDAIDPFEAYPELRSVDLLSDTKRKELAARPRKKERMRQQKAGSGAKVTSNGSSD